MVPDLVILPKTGEDPEGWIDEEPPFPFATVCEVVKLGLFAFLFVTVGKGVLEGVTVAVTLAGLEEEDGFFWKGEIEEETEMRTFDWETEMVIETVWDTEWRGLFDDVGV